MSTCSKIAVIGAACRLPGGIGHLDALWDVLVQARNVAREVPADRWNVDRFYAPDDVPGKTYVRRGHFMDWDFTHFDADFFGMTPREAESIDPQQRLLLELTWQALEDAGLDASALAGSNTGVYVGGFTLDHMLNQLGSGGREAISTHSAAGSTLTMLANRISYSFDFRGPSFSLDTACSSSLVAFAYACHDLIAGRCTVAIAGGANVMLRPEYAVAMAKGHFLAQDGRSKSFDARADGYGRGEGGGVVVLKSLTKAMADGDEILAVVEAAGVNQDGRTPGITVPNGASQQELMLNMLRQADLQPDQIAYVEAHGTGTPVGDPIEAAAIADVYGAGRDTPCVIGSVKSNIGHLEAAAGIAGILKAILVLRHQSIPAIAGLEQPNPGLPLHDGRIVLARDLTELPQDCSKRRVCVNSFGYGGTNAHVILGPREVHQPRIPAPASVIGRAVHHNVAPRELGWMLPISARHADALKELAKGYRERLSDTSVELCDVLYSAAHRRTHHSHRLAVWGCTRNELIASLDQYIQDNPATDTASGVRHDQGESRCVFVYTGMGPQWWGMGQELYRENWIYRQAVERADGLLRRVSGFSVLEEMLKDEQSARMSETQIAQPANLLLQVGLTEVLRSQGIVPAAVVGHSVGEVAAAWASGMLSLEDAVKVSFERSRVQQKAAGTGGMLAVGLPAEQVLELIERDKNRVSIAAINSPKGVTLAGDERRLDELAQDFETKGIFARRLKVEVPYHSPMMEALKPELRESLKCLAPRKPHTPLYSSVTAARVEKLAYDAEYWCDNVRNPVRFAEVIQTLLADGFVNFLEVGPHPVLKNSLAEIFTSSSSAEARSFRTLYRGEGEIPSVRRAIADTYVNGCEIEWQGVHAQGRFVPLPSYPWQRQLLWREPVFQQEDRLAACIRPLLGTRLAGRGWKTDLGDHRLAYFQNHVVGGVALLPAAAYLEAILQAEATTASSSEHVYCLRDVQIERPLLLAKDEAIDLELRVSENGDIAELWSSPRGSAGPALRHAVSGLHRLSVSQLPSLNAHKRLRSLPEEVSPDSLYKQFERFDLQYGPAFQSIQVLRRDRNAREVCAQLRLPPNLADSSAGYLAHPVLLDGCFQTVLSLLNPDDGAYLPTSVRALELYQPFPSVVYCYGALRRQTDREIECDLTVSDGERVIARILGLMCTSMQGGRRRMDVPLGDYIYQWRAGHLVSTSPSLTSFALLVERNDEIAQSLQRTLCERGAEVAVISLAEDSREDREQLLRERRFDAVVFMANANRIGSAPIEDPTGETSVSRLLAVLQQLAAQQAPASRLFVVTRGAVALEGDTQLDPTQGALVGLARVAFNELGALRCTTVDLPLAGAQTVVTRLAEELTCNASEDDVALRSSGRYVSELLESGVLAEPVRGPVEIGRAAHVAVRVEGKGERLTPVPCGEPRLTQSEMDVALETVVLGSDVFGRFLGSDDREGCYAGVVGRVLKVGSCNEVSPGQRICALVPFSLDTAIVVDTQTIPWCLVSDDMDAAEAAMLPLRVLVQRIANVAALTAGARSLVCRNALGRLLIDELASRGCDVTAVAEDPQLWKLNEIDAGDPSVEGFAAVAAPLRAWMRAYGAELLAPGGCMIDLSADARPIHWHPRVGRMVRVNPFAPIERRALAQGMQSVAASRTVYPHVDVRAISFIDLLEGKRPSALPAEFISIDYKAGGVVRDAIIETPAFREDGCYLVTGGFGGLGREVGRWLARNGAGNIILASRRGASTADDHAFLNELKSLGAAAVGVSCDMSDGAQVQQLVAGIGADGVPLHGIFHAAGVLEDKPILDMTSADLKQVMRPKALGAWHLHTACAQMPIEHFILFSSISVLVGNSRQGNYCAGNGFLDALAQHRYRMGLPALSVNWGAIEEVGMLSTSDKIEQHLRLIGLAPLRFSVGLAALERAMARGLPQICIAAQADWDQWARYEKFGGKSPRFAALVRKSRSAKADNPASRLAARLICVGPEDRTAIVAGLMQQVFARTLKIQSDHVDTTRPLDTLGVDSLMATEIQMQFERALGLSLPAMKLMSNATITHLASQVVQDLTIDSEAVAV